MNGKYDRAVKARLLLQKQSGKEIDRLKEELLEKIKQLNERSDECKTDEEVGVCVCNVCV